MTPRRQQQLLPPVDHRAHSGPGWIRAGLGRGNGVGFAPILDTERGVVAGFTGCPGRGRTLDPAQLASALATRPTLPRNTFLCLPLSWNTLAEAGIRAELLRPADLSGVVVELVGVTSTTKPTLAHHVTRSIQDAGGLIALQASDIWRPDFRALTSYSPKLIVLGPDWVRHVDRSPRQRAVVRMLGEVASERDAWVLGANITTQHEITLLAELGVPLLRGPAIGGISYDVWPPLALGVTAALGPQRSRPPGPLRAMLITVPTGRMIGDAVARMLALDGAPAAVVLDVYGRPVKLAVRTAAGVRVTQDVLCVHVDTPLRDVIARASARAACTDPVLAVDAAGRFLGVVPLEALC